MKPPATKETTFYITFHFQMQPSPSSYEDVKTGTIPLLRFFESLAGCGTAITFNIALP